MITLDSVEPPVTLALEGYELLKCRTCYSFLHLAYNVHGTMMFV